MLTMMTRGWQLQLDHCPTLMAAVFLEIVQAATRGNLQEEG